MSDHHRLHKEPPTSPSAVVATRSSRSSTLPSQESPRPKHRYRHRQHQSTSHRSHHIPRFSVDGGSRSGPTSSELSPLSLGEILKPVKRNAIDGLKPDGNRANRDQLSGATYSGKTIEEGNLEIPLKELGRAKRQRKAAERLLEDQYNEVAGQSYEQHVALADSRRDTLQICGRLDSALASLSKLQAETDTLLKNLTHGSIPELTEESRRQVHNFRATMTDIESNRIAKLRARVEAARESTIKLGDRMGEVRQRMKVWEDREADEVRRRRRRVGFVWGTVATMFLVILLLLIWGRVNERMAANEETQKDWTEIVIEKEMNRTGANGSEIVIAELLRGLREDEFRRSEQTDPKLPGEDAASEIDDGRLASIFDEL